MRNSNKEFTVSLSEDDVETVTKFTKSLEGMEDNSFDSTLGYALSIGLQYMDSVLSLGENNKGNEPNYQFYLLNLQDMQMNGPYKTLEDRDRAAALLSGTVAVNDDDDVIERLHKEEHNEQATESLMLDLYFHPNGPVIEAVRSSDYFAIERGEGDE